MNKKFIRCIVALVALSITFCIIAYADYELPPVPLTTKSTTTEPTTEPHEHSFEIVQFNNDTVFFKCSECEETKTMCFSDHLGDRNCDELDVVNDGVINAKDYVYLKNYYS